MAQSITCPKCGAISSAPRNFCAKCGAALGGQQPSAGGWVPLPAGGQPTATTQPMFIPFQGAATPQQVTPLTTNPSQANKPGNVASSKGLKVLWAIWVVFGVILIAITFYVFRRDETPAVAVAVTPTPTPKQVTTPAPTPTPQATSTPEVRKPPEAESVTTVEGADTQGNKGTFVIYVLTKNFSWKLISTTEVESFDSSKRGPDLFSPSLREEMRKALAVICAGTASFEGDRPREEDRASRRSRTIAQWVSEIRGSDKNIDTLNLGQYKGTDTGLSGSDQRRVILIAVTQMDGGLNKEQALKDALKKEQKKEPIFRSLLNDYSAFYLL